VLDQQLSNLIKSDDVMKFFQTEVLCGGFYERLVGLVKQSLRKGIGRKLLYWDKFLTMLVEVEAIINTHPLTYVYSEFSSGFTLTPAHFLSGNLDTVFQLDSDDCEETEYRPQNTSALELVDKWRKGLEQLNRFWEIWKRDYLLSLRATLPLYHRGLRSQGSRQPKIGEVVIVKDESITRRAWKLALIKEFIVSKDGQICSVKIELPNKQVISRAINQLYPLELQAVSNIKENSPLRNSSSSQDIPVQDSQPRPPPRTAGIQTRRRIASQLEDQPVMLAFFYPRECHGDDANNDDVTNY